jgi:hypothetical protein
MLELQKGQFTTGSPREIIFSQCPHILPATMRFARIFSGRGSDVEEYSFREEGDGGAPNGSRLAKEDLEISGAGSIGTGGATTSAPQAIHRPFDPACSGE